jgi:hypothetical protein
MKGDKCAFNYCDFYDEEEQACAEAVLVKKQLAVIRTAENEFNRVIEQARMDEDTYKKMVKNVNVMAGNGTMN